MKLPSVENVVVCVVLALVCYGVFVFGSFVKDGFDRQTKILAELNRISKEQDRILENRKRRIEQQQRQLEILEQVWENREKWYESQYEWPPGRVQPKD